MSINSLVHMKEGCRHRKEEGGTKAHTLVETFLLLPSGKEFVRLRTRVHTHTHNTCKTTRSVSGLGYSAEAGGVHFFHFHEMVKRRQQKDGFRTADLRHFS